MKFKVGDKVICDHDYSLDGEYGEFPQEGSLYTVSELVGEYSFAIEELEGKTKYNWWDNVCFILSAPAVTYSDNSIGVNFPKPNQLKIKKLHPQAVLPQYAKPGDAGMDITCTSVDHKDDQVIYGTSLAFEIPEGHVGLLFPRSSICKQDLSLSNSVGVIDSGYRGEVKFVFNVKPLIGNPQLYKVGERVGQIIVMPYPKMEVVEVTELSDTERGQGGFGSSGK